MKMKPIEIELRRLNLALLGLSPDVRDAVRRAVMRDVDGPEAEAFWSTRLGVDPPRSYWKTTPASRLRKLLDHGLLPDYVAAVHARCTASAGTGDDQRVAGTQDRRGRLTCGAGGADAGKMIK